jgi:hypothetical protein
MENLECELIRDFESGIREAERLLLPDGATSFQDVSRARMATAVHGCCGRKFESLDVLITCDECMQGDSSCSCLACFLKQNHEGHHVTVLQSSGVCDCGDPNSLRPGSFCPDHTGTDEVPDIRFVPESIRNQYQPIFDVVCHFTAESFPSHASRRSLDWLKSFKTWGDGCERLVVNSLVAGPLTTIAGKALAATSAASYVKGFLLDLINDLKLKRWVAGFVDSLVPDMAKSVRRALHGDGGVQIYDEFFTLVPQVVSRDTKLGSNQEVIRQTLEHTMESMR